MQNDIEKISDESVVEKVCAEDRELYAELMKRYQAKLMRYITNLIKDKDKSADVVQSTFIKAFINLNGFDTSKKFSSWLYRIAHNEAMNLIDKHQKETPFPEGFDVESEEDIEKDFEKNETREKIEKCLTDMPVLYSEPLSLYYMEEKTYEEISDILQIPMGTVATRISRAKLLMKKLCQTK
jgi:RNA polymerase sigma-70 factor (ECF subfamily)